MWLMQTCWCARFFSFAGGFFCSSFLHFGGDVELSEFHIVLMLLIISFWAGLYYFHYFEEIALKQHTSSIWVGFFHLIFFSYWDISRRPRKLNEEDSNRNASNWVYGWVCGQSTKRMSRHFRNFCLVRVCSTYGLILSFARSVTWEVDLKKRCETIYVAWGRLVFSLEGHASSNLMIGVSSS